MKSFRFHQISTLLLLFSFALSGQTTGEVRGVVMDPAGSLVQAAKVLLTSTETGESRSTATDPQGRYSFTLLKVGEYSVTVEAAGFRKTIAEKTNVQSAEITSVDLKLEIGQVTEQVFVTDAVSVLDTQSAQVQESFQSRTVADLPVSRNPNNVVIVMPGVVPSTGAMNSGSFFSQGNRARSNNITIDNITATDVSVAGTGSSNNAPLNFSSIKEIKVITNSFSAEFGRNSGAQVQYITKSGTNDFHGELYEYLQNSFFNSRSWFDTSGKAAVNRFNQFGGVLGGPVIRNKTHFFLASEIQKTRGLGAARQARVPTAAMRAEVTSPAAKALLEQYQIPLPQTEGATFGTVQQNASTKTDFHQWSTRIDHQISENDSIFGRIGTASNENASTANTFLQTNLANFGLASVNKIYSANINETHIFSPGLVNEFRAGFGRSSPIFVFDTTVPLGPRIRFTNDQLDRFGHYEGAPQGRVQNTFQYGDTMTWVTGPHNVKFGGDFYRYQLNSSQDVRPRGDFVFPSWQAFAQGMPSEFEQRFGSTVRGHRQSIYGAFFQDDWRITRKLTLNLGFRFEMFGPVSEVNGLLSNLKLDCRESLGVAGTGPLGCVQIAGNATGANYYPQPRLGFAWNLREKTVVRGGYGLLSDFNFLNAITNMRSLPPLVSTRTLTVFSGGNTFDALVAGTAPIQREGAALVGQLGRDVANYSDWSPIVDPSLKNPQVHSWSFGIQQQLPTELVLKVNYVGTKGNFLPRARQLNLNAQRPAPAVSLADELARKQEFQTSFDRMTGTSTTPSSRLDPRFNVVNYYDNSANSNFHALEVSAVRALRDWYSLQASYTWSKSIDDVSDALANLPNDSSVIQNPMNLRENRAVSAFDVPHRIVLMHQVEFPWGSRFGNLFAKRLLGGWGMSGISSWRSGFPVSFESGARHGLTNPSLITTSGVVRPNSSGPFNFEPRPLNSAGAWNGYTGTDPNTRISAYAASLGLSQPLLGNFGNLGRNTHRINTSANFDWNLYKNTAITERVHLQLRLEAYNVFNNKTFQDVNRNISSVAFGSYTSTNLNQLQRFLQLGAVVRF